MIAVNKQSLLSLFQVSVKIIWSINYDYWSVAVAFMSREIKVQDMRIPGIMKDTEPQSLHTNQHTRIQSLKSSSFWWIQNLLSCVFTPLHLEPAEQETDPALPGEPSTTLKAAGAPPFRLFSSSCLSQVFMVSKTRSRDPASLTCALPCTSAPRHAQDSQRRAGQRWTADSWPTRSDFTGAFLP